MAAPDEPPGDLPAPAAVGEEPLVAQAMARVRPELDPFVREVMRAQVAAALFGTRPPALRVGRYELRRELGTGGGGSVFEAWDPELTREVALKLMWAADPRLRARALAEGQALARLSHPNVVPVFDVGALEDRVYLVMELIRGQSLRAYAAGRKPREILLAYRQGCDGLAAAHAAKLVHRDFKPDNAVMGQDGRVRVIDFGLAVEDSADLGAGGGTPRYMAPEQRRGDALTAATDQYAFAVSLREALGQVPSWLERILARAEAPRPQDRHASMRALGAALALDPRTRWRRRALVAVPLALGVAGFWVGQARQDGPARCAGGAAALAPAWAAPRQQAVRAHLTALGTSYAQLVAPQVARDVDAYAARWIASHREGCLAHQRGELSEALYDRRQGCLSGARTQLATWVGLAERAEVAQLPELVRALPELADPAQCADAAALVGVDPPAQAQVAQVAQLTERLERARVLVAARTPQVVDELAALVAQARTLGYPPLLAQALLLQGTWFVTNGPYAPALAPLAEASELALRHRDYAVAVEAFARRAWVLGKEATAQNSYAGMPQMLALAAGLPPSGRFAEALLHNNLGSLHLTYDRPADARAELELSLAAAAKVDGPGTLELANALANLALVTQEEARRSWLFGQWGQLLLARLGPSHPSTLKAQIMGAIESGSAEAARLQLRASCGQMADLHPGQRDEICDCMFELGWLELMHGEDAAAHAAFAQAAAARADTTKGTLARAYLALETGDREQARPLLQPLREQVAQPTARWHELLSGSHAEMLDAHFALRAGQRALASAALTRVDAVLARAAQIHPSRSVLRRLAWVRVARAALTTATD